MIASARPPTAPLKTSSVDFTSLLPAIQRQIHFALRKVPSYVRQELIDEAIAASFIAFHRLVTQGKTSRVFATPLARFSVLRVRDGRRVGSGGQRYEACCPFSARRAALRVERLDRFDTRVGRWVVRAVPASESSIPDQVAFRLDFQEWLARQSFRNRQLIEVLASGESTGEAAHRFRISAARVSQLRLAFYESWCAYQREVPAHRSLNAA
jgi:hypothetical protein